MRRRERAGVGAWSPSYLLQRSPTPCSVKIGNKVKRIQLVVYTSVRLAALRADEHDTKIRFSRRLRDTAVGMPLLSSMRASVCVNVRFARLF
jgi:hypothetical protein